VVRDIVSSHNAMPHLVYARAGGDVCAAAVRLR
jgi:hypothetical protein